MNAKPGAARRSIRFSQKLLLTLACLYFLSLGLVKSAGLEPAIPWSFVPMLVLVSLPLAASLALIQGEADRRGLRSGDLRWPVRVGLGIVGLGVVYLSASRWLWLVVAAGLVPLAVSQWTWRSFRSVAFNWVFVVLGYACVWNFNYFVGWLVADRLVDASLVAADLWLFSTLGMATSYDGVFPLVQQPWLFQLLETAT